MNFLPKKSREVFQPYLLDLMQLGPTVPLRSDFDDASDIQQMEPHAGLVERFNRCAVVNFYEIERVVMDANHFVHAHPLRCSDCIHHAHGQTVADGENCEVQRCPVTDQLHVQAKSCISAVVEGAIRGLKRKPARDTAVSAVGQAARMLRGKALYRSEIKSELSAWIDGMRVFQPAFFEPIK